jgi:LPS sulfotransferase NodH
VKSWADGQAELARLAQQQLFFVGGAPRSGTTWLQQILDSHPDITCQGEGFFSKELAVPLETMMAQRRKMLDTKNTTLFQHTGGYPLPTADDVDHVIGTAILLALRQQSAGRACRAIGEKTPENVFFFPRLKRLFPAAKFIAIARDPRDVLTSAWHFFRTSQPSDDQVAAKMEFLRGAMPSLAQGARAMIAFGEHNPDSYAMVTYEALQRDPQPVVAGLFRLLGVSDESAVVADCLQRTSFAVATGGRPAGVAANGSFFRKGIAGDWRSTLTPAMNDLMIQELGWMFPHFGWEP